MAVILDFYFYFFLFPEQKNAIDSGKQVSWLLTREEDFNFRAAYWTDLHHLLYNSLPSDVVLWGHLFHSFHIADDNASVMVKAKILKTGEITEIVGDLLVAADGCFSSVRQKCLPEFKLRFVSEHTLILSFCTCHSSKYSSADIQVIVLGEGFLIFQRPRIQKS